MLKFYISSVFGILFGSIIGLFHNQSSFLIKQIIIIFLISIFFYFYLTKYNKVSQYKILADFVLKVIIFLTFFIIYNIYTFSFLKVGNNYDFTTNTNLKIINKVTNDDTVSFELKSFDKDILNHNANYYFAQNLSFINQSLKDIEIGDNLCTNITATKTYKIYDFVKDNNQSFDLANYYYGQGFDYYIKDLEVLNKDKCRENNIKTSWLDKVILIKNKISQQALQNFRENIFKAGANNYDNSIMMAMSWGDETLMTNNTKNIFRESGLSHILVLSGFNLILIMSFIFLLLKKMSVRKKLILTTILIFVFMIIANTSAPVWRAFIMSLYAMTAHYFFKSVDIKYALWLSLFIFSLISPLALISDISLHLSFLATMGIIYFFAPLKETVQKTPQLINNLDINIVTSLTDKGQKPDNVYNKLKSLLIDSLLITIAASIMLIPYLLYQFNNYNFFSIIFNIFITFLIPVITIFSIVVSLYYIPILSETLYFIISLCIKFVSYITNISAGLNQKVYIDIDFINMLFIYCLIFIFYKILLFYRKINA